MEKVPTVHFFVRQFIRSKFAIKSTKNVKLRLKNEKKKKKEQSSD